MSPIPTFGLSKLTPKQFAQFIRNVLSLLVSLASDQNIKKMVDQINLYLTELDAAMGRAISCEYTAQLESLDYLRDELIRVLDKYLDFAVSASMLDKTRADQAKVVLEMRNRYDERIAYLSYQEETTAITAMVVGFQTITGAVEESNAEIIISALDKANRKFEALYIDKIKTVAIDPKVRQTRAIRLDIVAQYEKLIGYINGVAPFNPVLFTAVVDSINVIVSDVKALAAAAKTRHATELEKAVQAV